MSEQANAIQSASVRESLGLNRLWQVGAFLFAFFAILASCRYKVAGAEAVRPFHFAAVLGFCAITTVFAVGRLPLRLLLDRQVLVFGGMLAWVVAHGLLNDYRSLIDSIYIAAISGSSLVFLLMVVSASNREGLLKKTTLFAIILSYVATGQALLSWTFLIAGDQGSEWVLGSGKQVLLPFLQSPTYLGRMHGFFGDPTIYGVFCALALVLLAVLAKSWRARSLVWYRLCLGGVFLSAFGLIGSGSRMGLTAVAVMVFAAWTRRSVILLFLAVLFCLAMISLVIVDTLRYSVSQKLEPVLISMIDDNECKDTGINLKCSLERIKAARKNYFKETLRISDFSATVERREFLVNGLKRYIDAPMSQKLLGCGVGCVERDGTRSLIGFLDLLNNYGFVFLAMLAFTWILALLRIWPHSDWTDSVGLCFLLGVGIMMFFGYWLFHPFFNVTLLAMLFAVAVSAVRSVQTRGVRWREGTVWNWIFRPRQGASCLVL